MCFIFESYDKNCNDTDLLSVFEMGNIFILHDVITVYHSTPRTGLKIRFGIRRCYVNLEKLQRPLPVIHYRGGILEEKR